jgi:hypothetical protein
MRKLIILLLLFNCNALFAQNKTDVNSIVLNALKSDKEEKITLSTKNLLKTKLEQIATNSGVDGNSINQRFIVAVKVIMSSKDLFRDPHT